MSFGQETNVSPVSIADFEIVLFVPGPDNPESQTGRLNAQIVMSDGSIRNRSFNLLARLQDDATGQGHLSNLVALRNYIKTRLDNEVIP